MRVLAITCVLLLLVGQSLAQDEPMVAIVRQAVPPATQQTAARQTLESAYARELAAAKTAVQKSALARQWIAEAEKSGAEVAEQFILLLDAAQLAAQAGDAQAVGTALGGLMQRFQWEEIDLALKHFTQVQRMADTKPAAYILAMQASAFAEHALEIDRYQIGEELAQLAAVAARKSGDALAIRLTAGRAEDAKEIAAEYAQIQNALGVLKQRPGDAAANLAVGRFHCFSKNRWDLGLPMLALGSDAALQKLAEAELRAGNKSTLALADQWWKLAEARPDTQLPLQFRAVWHYERIAAELDGLARKRVGQAIVAFWSQHSELFFRREVRGAKALTSVWQTTSREPVVTIPLHGRQRVWVTHPFDKGRAAKLTRTTWLPEKPGCVLVLDVASHAAINDWTLEARINGQVALSKLIKGGAWESQRIDLSAFAGQEVTLELVNRAGGKRVWAGERGYWDNVAIVPK